MRTLENQGKGAGGEIQLTDAMARMIGHQPFHAVTFNGKRYDCGSKVGYIEANLAVALQRPDMADEVRAIAKAMLAD
jgi:UTP--glucose-1-phosphate uridylyltransferase